MICLGKINWQSFLWSAIEDREKWEVQGLRFIKTRTNSGIDSNEDDNAADGRICDDSDGDSSGDGDCNGDGDCSGDSDSDGVLDGNCVSDSDGDGDNEYDDRDASPENVEFKKR